MKGAQHVLLISMIVLAALAVWSYQPDITRSEAAGVMAQTTGGLVLVPPRTEVRAVLPYGITESTKPGDRVVAFVAEPVTIGTEVAIPVGSLLNGTIDEIYKSDGRIAARLDFSFDDLKQSTDRRSHRTSFC